jgi:hypothetical protein
MMNPAGGPSGLTERFSQIFVDGHPCRDPAALWAQLASVVTEGSGGLPPPGAVLTVQGKPRRVELVYWHPRTGRVELRTKAAA